MATASNDKDKVKTSDLINLNFFQKDRRVRLAFLLSLFGIILFSVIAVTVPLRDALLNSLFPKPPSQAAGPGITFVDASGQTISQTTSSTVSVNLTSPWPATSLTYNPPPEDVMGIVDQAYAQTSPTTKTFSVLTSSDDANEDGASLDLTSKKAWIGNGQSASLSYTGLRFSNITIPRGANISSAKLQVYSSQSQWIAVNTNVRAHLIGSSPTFSSSNKPSQRTRTNASVNHSSNVRWNSNTWYTLDEMKSVIQEIVNRSDWNSGNSLSIIMKGSGSSFARKFVSSFNTGSTYAPKLIVTYTGSTTAPTSTPTLVPSSTPTRTPTPRPTSTPTLAPPTATQGPVSSNTFSAILNGPSEVPANGSAATGNTTAVLNGNILTLSMNFSGLSSAQTAAHLHGPSSTTSTAGPFWTLPNGQLTNYGVSLTTSQVDMLKRGEVYVNVHTTNYPGGEIRGQLLTSGGTGGPTSTPTPIILTQSAVLAEDAAFTQNVVSVSPFSTNPMAVNYTFSNPSLGTKTLYVRFTSDTGLAQTYSGTIDLVAQAATPTTALSPTPTPVQTSGTPIWGAVDPTILGECSSAVHDKYVVDGNDGFRYRTWHPQHDPSNCDFAHEHGDDPNTMTDTWVRANWDPRFGYAARRMTSASEPNGHVESHEGFKVFSANIGLTNDEGRVNRTASLSSFHMGTGGPKRFTVQHHSNSIAYRYQTGTPYSATHLMLDTGGVSDVCDPRTDAPTKDALTLQNRCKVNSAYEIWGTTQSIKNGGNVVYRVFVTPAVFDPITVFNRDNPLEVVYAWDPRVAAIKNFNNDWSGHRGCKRENYAQVGYFYNAGGPTTYYTDHMGNVVPQSNSNAIRQIVSSSNVVGLTSTQDNLQFKMPMSYCQGINKLGLKN